MEDLWRKKWKKLEEYKMDIVIVLRYIVLLYAISHVCPYISTKHDGLFL